MVLEELSGSRGGKKPKYQVLEVTTSTVPASIPDSASYQEEEEVESDGSDVGESKEEAKRKAGKGRPGGGQWWRNS